MATAPVVLEFGSRSGSWFALGVFTLMFGVLGFAVAREVRLRTHGTRAALGRLLGLSLFVIPVSLIYVSMVGGFYEAEIAGNTIRLRYFVPNVVTELPAAIVSARLVPAYRDRVRLVIAVPNGSYESTPWPRALVVDSLTRLRRERLIPDP
jgi:hypothetical protein